MLLGDSGVGKTCLLVRFKDKTFLSGAFIATVGIDYRVNDVLSGREEEPLCVFMRLVSLSTCWLNCLQQFDYFFRFVSRPNCSRARCRYSMDCYPCRAQRRALALFETFLVVFFLTRFLLLLLSSLKSSTRLEKEKFGRLFEEFVNRIIIKSNFSPLISWTLLEQSIDSRRRQSQTADLGHCWTSKSCRLPILFHFLVSFTKTLFFYF